MDYQEGDVRSIVGNNFVQKIESIDSWIHPSFRVSFSDGHSVFLRFSARRKINRRREYQRNLGKETFSKIMKEKETQIQKTEVKDRPQFRRGFGIKQESQEMTDLKRKIESDLKKSPVSHDNNIEVRSNVNYTNNTEKKNEKKGLFRMFD